MMNSVRNLKFIKNTKAHNVYHRCLCFIFVTKLLGIFIPEYDQSDEPLNNPYIWHLLLWSPYRVFARETGGYSFHSRSINSI